MTVCRISRRPAAWLRSVAGFRSASRPRSTAGLCTAAGLCAAAGLRPARALALAAACALLLARPGPAPAQLLFPPAGPLVETSTHASLTVFHPGSRGFIAVEAKIQEGWHINSNAPLDEYLIPTVLELTPPAGVIVERIIYPEADLVKLDLSSEKMSLYHGTVFFGAAIRIAGDAAPGAYEIGAVLRYQGCNNMLCLEPAGAVQRIPIRVGTSAETTALAREDIFSGPLFADAPARPAAAGEDRLIETLERRGLLLALVFVFLGGLALNLTPCIYPLIPITVSYFGGQADGRTSRTLVLALLYVLGMSITYSILGTVAAVTGGLLGAALQNPLVIAFIAAVLLALAASMFGVWEFRLPAFMARGTGRARRGYWGAVVMGLTVGIVAAPCIGPFVLGLLTWVGETGRPALGFLLFFTLAWGMGTPFIILGTASGSLSRLPRSGHWMVWVRKIFGFVLVLMAIYFARHVIGTRAASIGYAAVALAAGLALGWFDRTPQTGAAFAVVKRLVGLAWIVLAAVILALPGGALRPAPSPDGIEWQAYTDEAVAAAAAAGRPVMIDFSADWCIPCRELEHRTFSDPAVKEYSERFARLKVDLTAGSEEGRRLMQEYLVRGVPTVIFLDSSGAEPADSRVTGFLAAEEFLERMKRAGGN